LNTLKKVVTIFCILFLCAGFLGVGMLKLVNYPSIVESFVKWGIPVYFKYVLGLFEILLAIGIFYRPTRKFAILSGFILMTAAIYVHLSNNEAGQLYGPVFVCALLISLLISDDLI
jgi:uncharacterized membrane protein YphA (DoxX/SURF4 family)